MSLFRELEGDAAIVVSGGVYKHVKVYLRDGYLFAGFSGGYVRLKADGTTSKDKLRLDHLETGIPLHKDHYGRLGTNEIKDAQPIASDEVLRIAKAA